MDAAQPPARAGCRRRRTVRRERISYGIPDVLGAARDRYAGKRVLVVGSGHSAFNVLLDLVELREAEPATEIVWVIPATAGPLFGGGDDDALPARGALGARARSSSTVGRLVSGFRRARWVRDGGSCCRMGQGSRSMR